MPGALRSRLLDDTLLVFLSDTHIGGVAGSEIFQSAAELTALLQGSKLVYRRRAIGPWRATTRLEAALAAPADRYDATVPTGTLTISAPGVARMLLSLRPTGATGIGAAVATLLRFARFFTTRVLLAFLPVGPARRQDGHPLDPRVPTATSE